MLGEGNRVKPPRAIQIILDGRKLQLPEQVRDSFLAIRSYLELLALQQERVVSVLSVDGCPVGFQGVPAELGDFQSIQAQTISFAELSRQLIETACGQVGALQTQVEAAAMQVLINDWSAVEKLWREWTPAFLSPLLIIRSLRDLCGTRIDELLLGRKTLAEHLAEFGPLWKRIERTFEERDILELSNALEQLLGPWLERLLDFLVKLNEE